jgi:class 3 adenylate cyclase
MPEPIINEPLLETKLTELERVRTWSPRVISRLESMIRTADDYALFRINAIQYANEKGLVASEAIDLFLYGTKFGLFEMGWNLVCRSCGHLIENFTDLARVHSHAICDICRADFDAALDDFIQVSFTVSQQIRDIIYHHPEQLSIEDFYLKYHLCKSLASVGGEPFAARLKGITRLMTYLAPGEKTAAEIDVIPGMLGGTDLLNKATINLFTDNKPPVERQEISLKVEGSQFRLPGRDLAPARLAVGDVVVNMEKFGQIGVGKAYLEVENQTDKRCAIWISNYPMEGALAANLPKFDPFLSGKQLLTTQTFRDLFRSEVVQTNEGLAVQDITILFTDLKGSTAMYDAVGDPQAWYLVRQHFDTLGRVVARHSGAIVKTIGDAVMATFLTPADAVRASLAMLDELQAFNRTITENLVLKIGVHKGHCIAVTLNDRVDYFGQTVNIAARIQALADADEIYLSHSVYNDPAVRDALTGHQVIPVQTAVKGVSAQLQVYKVTKS